ATGQSESIHERDAATGVSVVTINTLSGIYRSAAGGLSTRTNSCLLLGVHGCWPGDYSVSQALVVAQCGDWIDGHGESPTPGTRKANATKSRYARSLDWTNRRNHGNVVSSRKADSALQAAWK